MEWIFLAFWQWVSSRNVKIWAPLAYISNKYRAGTRAKWLWRDEQRRRGWLSCKSVWSWQGKCVKLESWNPSEKFAISYSLLQWMLTLKRINWMVLNIANMLPAQLIDGRAAPHWKLTQKRGEGRRSNYSSSNVLVEMRINLTSIEWLGEMLNDSTEYIFRGIFPFISL